METIKDNYGRETYPGDFIVIRGDTYDGPLIGVVDSFTKGGNPRVKVIDTYFFGQGTRRVSNPRAITTGFTKLEQL